jgi:hypothetical protein
MIRIILGLLIGLLGLLGYAVEIEAYFDTGSWHVSGLELATILVAIGACLLLSGILSRFRRNNSFDTTMKHQSAWKVYFWFSLLIFAREILKGLRDLPNMTPDALLIYFIKAITIIGLFGFVYRKKLGRESLWKVILVFHFYFLIFKPSISFYYLSMKMEDMGYFLLMVFFACFEFLPIFYSNILYAFKSKELWS